MNRTFDFYEYAGIIVPGAILTLGLLYFFPEGRALFAKDGITFGELGLFVIVAYAAGHVVQGVGNWLEWAWWKLWGGIPSRRVLAGKLLSAEQHRRLVKALQADAKIVGETVEILNNQGFSYMLRGDFKRARAKLLLADSKDPGNKYVANNMRLLDASLVQGKQVE